MGQAKREGGLYYRNGIAVDANGNAVKDAPELAPNTVPSAQPGGKDAESVEERIARGIAAALSNFMTRANDVGPSSASTSSGDTPANGTRPDGTAEGDPATVPPLALAPAHSEPVPPALRTAEVPPAGDKKGDKDSKDKK